MFIPDILMGLASSIIIVFGFPVSIFSRSDWNVLSQICVSMLLKLLPFIRFSTTLLSFFYPVELGKAFILEILSLVNILP